MDCSVKIAHQRFPRLFEIAGSARNVKYVIRLEAGVQSPETNPAIALRLMSRFRVAAGQLVPAHRNCRPLCFGLPHSVDSGCQQALDGPSGTGNMTSPDLHAWAEVYLPGAGWAGLDATSGLLAGEGQIPLACSPDIQRVRRRWKARWRSARPSSRTDEMKVTRIYESPRASRTYTEEQWAQINALGHRIDLELAQSDVRLTLGGVPTFVSIDNMDGRGVEFHGGRPGEAPFVRDVDSTVEG